MTMTMIMMMDSCNTKSFHQEPTTVVEDSNAVVMLPEDFQPGETEVIIGRGKKCATHSGNRRFRELVNEELTEYSEATTKAHKSTIIVRILTQVRALSPHPFVKQDLTSRRWYSVGESAQRNTTAQAFRDALADSYKSSRYFKKQKREKQKKKQSVEDRGQAVGKGRKVRVPKASTAKICVANSNDQVLRDILDEATDAMTNQEELEEDLVSVVEEPPRACDPVLMRDLDGPTSHPNSYELPPPRESQSKSCYVPGMGVVPMGRPRPGHTGSGLLRAKREMLSFAAAARMEDPLACFLDNFCPDGDFVAEPPRSYPFDPSRPIDDISISSIAAEEVQEDLARKPITRAIFDHCPTSPMSVSDGNESVYSDMSLNTMTVDIKTKSDADEWQDFAVLFGMPESPIKCNMRAAMSA